MVNDTQYQMRVNAAWLLKVKKFASKHKMGSVSKLIRQAVDYFMENNK